MWVVLPSPQPLPPDGLRLASQGSLLGLLSRPWVLLHPEALRESRNQLFPPESQGGACDGTSVHELQTRGSQRSLYVSTGVSHRCRLLSTPPARALLPARSGAALTASPSLPGLASLPVTQARKQADRPISASTLPVLWGLPGGAAVRASPEPPRLTASAAPVCSQSHHLSPGFYLQPRPRGLSSKQQLERPSGRNPKGSDLTPMTCRASVPLATSPTPVLSTLPRPAVASWAPNMPEAAYLRALRWLLSACCVLLLDVPMICFPLVPSSPLSEHLPLHPFTLKCPFHSLFFAHFSSWHLSPPNTLHNLLMYCIACMQTGVSLFWSVSKTQCSAWHFVGGQCLLNE